MTHSQGHHYTITCLQRLPSVLGSWGWSEPYPNLQDPRLGVEATPSGWALTPPGWLQTSSWLLMRSGQGSMVSVVSSVTSLESPA